MEHDALNIYMNTVTWRPGTNSEMDHLFDALRTQQYQTQTHKLRQNYSPEDFLYWGAVALTICFDDAGMPEMCSCIASRPCWPDQVYRITSRMWKHANRRAFARPISPSFSASIQSQINWLDENTQHRMYFISRQTKPHWQDYGIASFKQTLNIDFSKSNKRYLTCPDANDESCWQEIIYVGDQTVLSEWSSK